MTCILSDMAMTPAERKRKQRRREGVKPRGPLVPCGTPSGRRRHQRRGEPVCEECREASRLESAKYNERKRQRKAAEQDA